MAIKSKVQLAIDIASSTFTAPQQVILDDMVDSYEDIFSQLTTVQRDLLTPTAGLIIYNTDTDLYEYWNGVSWSSWSGINTPMTVKVDWSASEIRQSFSVAKILVAAPGAGFSLAPISVMWRYTYGSIAFDFPADLHLKFSTKAAANKFFSLDLTGAVSTSGLYGCVSTYSEDSIVENDNITLKATTANATVGDGTLSIWLTYSLVAW